jgi:hypothetical protein
MTVAPALLVVAWLAVALPLLMGRSFTIGPALALFVLSAVLFLSLGFRGTTREAELGLAVGGRRVSWWVVAGVGLVTLAFLALEIVFCSQQLVVLRDPATYANFAGWLNDQGSLPISQQRWAFGGHDPALGFASPGFYQQGSSIVPQFMAGMPLILSLGGWIGGPAAMLLMAPVLGAAAVLSFGGLTARLIGPRWAPLGALALALCLPMQWVARSSYSEIPTMVLLFGGLSLLHDVRELGPERRDLPRWKQPVRVRAGLAGLALGLMVLCRIDGLRDILPVIVFAGLLVARRRKTGLPLLAGLAIGTVAGLAEGYTYSRPYLRSIASSLNPLLALAAVILAGTVVMAALLLVPVTGRPLRRMGRWIGRSRLPDAAGFLPVLVMIGFALRPAFGEDFRTPRTPDDLLNARYIQHLQRLDHLPLQWGRQYTELSLYWVVWYVGIPALLLGTFGAALLVRRLLRLPGRGDRTSAEWLLPLGMISWTTVLTLARPGITPDQPWASRHLVPLVIPGVLLLAMWALAWSFRRFRRLGYGRKSMGAVAAFSALLLTVPIGIAAAPLAFARTEHGELGATNDLCQKLGQGASVLIVERVTADRFSQLVRSQCGLPTARVLPPKGSDVADEATVRRLINKILALNRRPIVLAAEPSQVRPYGTPQPAFVLHTRQDGHSLTRPPHNTWGLTLTVYMAESDADGSVP